MKALSVKNVTLQFPQAKAEYYRKPWRLVSRGLYTAGSLKATKTFVVVTINGSRRKAMGTRKNRSAKEEN